MCRRDLEAAIELGHFHVAWHIPELRHPDVPALDVLAVLLGLAGVALAFAFYGRRRLAVPRIAWAQTLLEHKFYFDEAYDFAFYRPAVWLSLQLGRWVEGLIIGGSIREIAQGVREAGLGTGRLQTGLVRTYALTIAASLAVITVVFVAVR